MAKQLLREFGSIANIQRAGVEKLSSVVPRKSAEKILAHLDVGTAEAERIEEGGDGGIGRGLRPPGPFGAGLLGAEGDRDHQQQE